MLLRHHRALLILFLAAAGAIAAQTPAPSTPDLLRLFATPPEDARILMRWWWFGPAVEKPELQREILAMKAGGIGGFEVQPVYPLALDDAGRNFRNLPYLSPEFLDAVRFTAGTARSNGMRMDMTLASGWPYGGPGVSIDHASARLRLVALDLPPSATSVAVPSLGNGEALIALFAGEGTAAQYDPVKLHQLPLDTAATRLALPASATPSVILFFISSRTGQQVKRPAVGAEGFVLDHFDRVAVEEHLRTVGEPLLAAFGDHPPYAVFSDSLEAYGADWTPDLPAEFARRRGYELLPHLPELFSGNTAQALGVRHDWGQTLTELINERYLTPINTWATAHGTRFRSQTYGDPAVSLSSNRLVALPEGEGFQWRRFSYTRWATSASHLYGRPVTSAETWTWLHSPAFRATPLDMKAEADLFFLQGVNQLIGHGWPYTPPGIPEPGWSFYAAAVFNDHNPWWPVMPELTSYLQRVSYLLRQGEPANDIAVLLPIDDAYATFTPGHVNLADAMPRYMTPALTESMLNAGYNFDYMDSEAVLQQGIHHPILILPRIERLSGAVLARIADYAEGGGKVIAIGTIPSQRASLSDDRDDIIAWMRASQRLYGTRHLVDNIDSEADLASALKPLLAADLQLTTPAPELGFLHRRLPHADLYFLANTGNHDLHTAATFRDQRPGTIALDPMTGSASHLHSGSIPLDLAPYESRVLLFTDETLPIPSAPSTSQGRELADLSTGWTITFPHQPVHALSTFTSWTDDPATRFFSGEAIYSRNLKMTALLPHTRLLLDFGLGKPLPLDESVKFGMRALLDPPIREAAIVFVNGTRAGALWHPPYTLDLTPHLHPGANHLEIHVYNTAINTLAGRTLPDYRLLNSRYGQRFTPQDMDNLQPLPSGIIGPVRLLASPDR